jgi:outer membrane lipoprotein-sorting protein
MNRLLATLFVAAGLLPAQSVDQFLARLDTAASTFKGAKADMRRTKYLASIGESDVETGSSVVRRTGTGTLEFRIDIDGANANTYIVRGQSIEHYMPGLNQIDVYDFRKYRDLAQKLMVLGFGMSGRELKADYAISNLRRETVAGRPTTAVDLTPKSQEVLDLHLNKVQLWVSDDTAAPAQQKLYFRDGPWTVEYFNVQLNPKLPANVLDLPKGAKRVKVQ